MLYAADEPVPRQVPLLQSAQGLQQPPHVSNPATTADIGKEVADVAKKTMSSGEAPFNLGQEAIAHGIAT
jgi:hypothetical protein